MIDILCFRDYASNFRFLAVDWERLCVLVNAHLQLVECVSYFAETSLQLDCKIGASTDALEKNNEHARPIIQEKKAVLSVG